MAFLTDLDPIAFSFSAGQRTSMMNLCSESGTSFGDLGTLNCFS